eukprot:6129027-Pleurochrysis_carterae.AAC.1
MSFVGTINPFTISTQTVISAASRMSTTTKSMSDFSSRVSSFASSFSSVSSFEGFAGWILGHSLLRSHEPQRETRPRLGSSEHTEGDAQAYSGGHGDGSGS